ncbi:MAG: TonB-dependent receptor family protein [Tannerellaceae bacterium]|jgi:hypothetical protein|nr:TonB-dependent receptor family protein [Tannerellaceae bacterium]
MNIIKKTAYGLIAVVAIQSAILAQSRFNVTGSVIDESNAEVVENFYLAVRQDSILVAYALTDELGRFSFNLPEGTYILSGYYWGNRLMEEEISVHNPIELPPWKVKTGFSLNEVQIVGNRTLLRREENKLVFNVQNLSEIDSYKAVDILKYVPRVNVDLDNGVTLGNHPAAIFLDGRRLSTEETATYLKTLNAKDIEKIEVQQANDGTQFADIGGGIIHIITKSKRSGFDLTSHNRFSAADTENGSVTPSVNIFWGKENYNIYFAYKLDAEKLSTQYGNTNNYPEDGITYTKPDDNETTKGNRHDFTIGSIVNIGKKSMFGIHLNRNYANSQSASLGPIGINRNTAEKDRIDNGTYQGHYASNSVFQNLAASYLWTIDTLAGNLKIQYNHNMKDNVSDNLIRSDFVTDKSRNVDETNRTEADSRNHSFRYDLRKNTATGWSFRHGGQYLQSRRNSLLEVKYPDANQNSRSDWRYDEKITAGYMGISRTFGNKYIYANVRAENTILKGILDKEEENLNKNYTDFFPYFTFTHKIDSKWSYELFYSKSIYRPPFSLLNNYKNRTSDNIYDVGNPDLLPQLSHNLSAGVSYGNHSVELFGYRTPNLIMESFTLEDGIIYHTNINGGSSRRFGIDYSYNGKVWNRWFLNFYLGGEYDIFPQNYAQNHYYRISSSMNNRFSSPIGEFNLNINYNNGFLSGNVLVKPDYYADVSYNKSFRWGTVQAGISDIFNTSKMRAEYQTPYLEYSFYRKRTTRTLWVSLVFNFKTDGKVNKEKISNPNTIINRF